MSQPRIPRRTLMQGAAAVGAAGAVGAVVPGGAAHAAAPVTLTDTGITLVAAADGTVVIGDGTDRVQISHFMFTDTVIGQYRTFGGVPTATTVDGRPAVRIQYAMPAAASPVAVTGTFWLTPYRARVRWEVTGSATLAPEAFCFARSVLSAPTAAEKYVGVTRWTKDSRGGIPYEINIDGLYQETWATTRAFIRAVGSVKTSTSATWLHAPGTVSGTGTAVTETDIVLGQLRPPAAATVAGANLVSVELWSDKPFNLWEAAGETMTLRAQVVNGKTTTGTVAVAWTARDFDGDLVAEGTQSVVLKAGEMWHGSIPVTAPAQGVVFTEVTATLDGHTAFARTNLAVLPSFAYKAGAESMFGIANYPWLLVPSKADVGALMQKIGVKWVRIAYKDQPGIPTKELDALGIHHNVQKGPPPIGKPAEEKAKWAAEIVAICQEAETEYYEAGNELNQPWWSGEGAAAYVQDALVPLRQAMSNAGATFKVMNAGTGGGDNKWLNNVNAAKGWDLIDVVAIHPGRGNFTPDFAPSPEEWEEGSNGSYWNFLGGVRAVKHVIETHGEKELWLTEAYSCTKPNSWWHDTFRHGAENVLLTLALAKAEGIRAVNWYQLHDSIVHQPQVANPGNPEYHYGLMNRDTSAKPSLLAYATAARVLDQATFVRWLRFADTDLKGLLFRTPAGPVSILWSRKDGYTLNAEHGTDSWWPSPEPWVDTWATKTPVLLPATSASVRELDCIGRERVLTRVSGKVTVELDGAPRVYYGLSEELDRLCVKRR